MGGGPDPIDHSNFNLLDDLIGQKTDYSKTTRQIEERTGDNSEGDSAHSLKLGEEMYDGHEQTHAAMKNEGNVSTGVHNINEDTTRLRYTRARSIENGDFIDSVNVEIHHIHDRDNIQTHDHPMEILCALGHQTTLRNSGVS